MVLAEALKGPSGHILLPKGQALKKSLIQRFNSWGIDSVYIIDEENDDTKEDLSPEELTNRIANTFISTHKTPLELDLIQALAKARLEQN
jgi:hypothetical protein